MIHAVLWAFLAATQPTQLTQEEWLALPIRERWALQDERMQPERVVETLKLRDGDIVVDLGAGKGYYTRHLGRAVAPTGRVIALDVSRDALVENAKIAAEDGLTNVETRVVARDDPQLTSGEADLIFISRTWNFLPERFRYAQTLRESIRPDTRVAVIGHGTERVPRAGRRRWSDSNRFDTQRELEAGGFRIVEEYDYIPSFFFFVMRSGRAAIFDLVEDFFYLDTELASGCGPLSAEALAAIHERGFLKVIDIRAQPMVPVEVGTALAEYKIRYVSLSFPLERAEEILETEGVLSGTDAPAPISDLIRELQDKSDGVVFLWADNSAQAGALAYGLNIAEAIPMTKFQREALLQRHDVRGHPIARAVRWVLTGRSP